MDNKSSDNESVVLRFFEAVDPLLDFDETVDIPEGFFDTMSTTTKPTIRGIKGTTPWTGGKPSDEWTKSENNRPNNSILFCPSVEKDVDI